MSYTEQAKIDLDVIDDESSNISNEIVEVPLMQNPIPTQAFAEELKTLLQEYSSNFVVSEKMMDVFNSYCSTFNKVTNDNVSGKRPRRYIVPLATGSAKTTAMKLYGGMTKGTALFVVRKAMDAVQIVRDINKIAKADVARTYYSVDAKNGRPDTAERVIKDELKDYRVIVATHTMFHNLSKHSQSSTEHLGVVDVFSKYRNPQLGVNEPRETIVIDERIDLTRSEDFDSSEVEYTIEILEKAKGVDLIAKHIDGLKTFLQLFKYDRNRAVGNKVGMSSPKQTEVMAKNSGLFLKLIEAIKVGKLELTETPKIRGLKIKESDQYAIEKSIIELLKRIHFVINNNMIVVQQGKRHIASAVQDLSMAFGSVAILDATANINKMYDSYLKHQESSTVMFEKPEIRNYQNTTFYVAKGFPQSASGLYSKSIKGKSLPMTDSEKLKVVLGYLEMLYPVVNEDDNMLVVVHKDILPVFIEQCRMKNITFINWGNHAGSNAWSHYNKSAIIGWYRISSHHYYNQLFAGAKNYLHYEPTISYDEDATNLEYSSIMEDMIQFFNRIRCRVSTDEGGNHLPVELYMFSSDNTASKKIINGVVAEFKNATVNDWNVTPATALKKKRTKMVERADNIIAVLKREAGIKGDVRGEDIRARLGTTKVAFTKTVNSEYFKKELKHYGIKHKRLEGVSGKPLYFDFEEVKNL